MSQRITPESAVESAATETVQLPDWATAAVESARDLSEKGRTALVMECMTAHDDFSAAIGRLIMTAPAGPTASETLTAHIAGLVEKLAGFVLASRPHDCDADVPALLTAAMSRVQPDTAAVEKVLAGASGRTRTTIVRDHSSAVGDYRSEKGNKVRVSVDAATNVPTFHVGRKGYSTATAATRAADWNGEKGNWGNPYEKWTDADGVSLGDRCTIVTAAD
jgi:hypothetical protein